MAEVRHKLTEKQYSSYNTARQRAVETEQLARVAREQLSLVAELILDFYGVDTKMRTSIDDATKELIVAPRDEASTAPEAPAEPVKAAKRSKKPAAVPAASPS